MPRRLQLLWLPLLALLVSGPLATRASLRGAEVLRGGESIGSAPLYTLPTARTALALQPGAQPFRHGAPAWAAVPGQLEAHVFEHRLLTIAILAGGNALAGTARHFPLFPTGPPAHS